MENDVNYKPHNLMLSGNSGFVPAWFSQAQIATSPVMQPMLFTAPATQASMAPVVKPAPAAVVALVPVVKPPSAAMVAVPPVAVAVPAPATPPVLIVPAPAPVVAALTGEQALRQMFDQRDAKRRVQVSMGKTKLKIGQDALDFAVQSDKAGYVYVALAGSDNKSVYMLFPNDLDRDNKIEAGQTLLLPRPNWRVKAGGPVGNDNLLILVTDGPRDLSQLAAAKVGPFVTSLNDADGRAKLGALMSTSRVVTSQACQNNATRKNNPLCSDAYGAFMASVEEVK